MPANSFKNDNSHRTGGKPSEGVMKKAQAYIDANRMPDVDDAAIAPHSPERFGKLRQRTDDTIFKNDQMEDSNINDISRNNNAGMQKVAGTAKKPNTWRYDGRLRSTESDAQQMKRFQEGDAEAGVPASLQQRRGRIYGEDANVRGARDESAYEKAQQQRFAAQQRERHLQQEMRNKAEDAAERSQSSASQQSGLRWGDAMGNMDRNEGGYLDRNVPKELESSFRKNPYAAPRNETAAKRRSANSSPFPQPQGYMYGGSAGTDYPQGNVRYYEHDDEGNFEDDRNEDDGEYNDNKRFWDYEARSPNPQQQLKQDMKQHPGNLYGGEGIMTAAEGEIDEDVYEEGDSDDSEAPFSSSAFDSLDYEYLCYVNEREAIKQRLNEAREQRRRSMAMNNRNGYDYQDDDEEYYDQDEMYDDEDEDLSEDRNDDDELADLDARVNYLLYLRSLQARGDPDAEGLLREYYHAHYGSEAYERARERFMNRLDEDDADEARMLKNEILEEDEGAGDLDGLDDDELFDDEDDEAIIDEVLERSQLRNPYPNLVPYHWSSAAPKRMREEIAYNDEDFFEDDDEDEADMYDHDYEDDGDYDRQGPSIYNTYGGVLQKQSRPEIYNHRSAPSGLNDDIYKDSRQNQSNRTTSATAAANGAMAAASAARAAQQIGKPKDNEMSNKKPFMKQDQKNLRTYTVPSSVAKYNPTDGEIMLLFFGVLPFSEDLSLGRMARDRKPREMRQPRGVINGPRNLAAHPQEASGENHFMYSNAPAPTKDQAFEGAIFPFAMDDDNGAMPNDKKFGDGQLILMEQARKEKNKRDIERGFDPATRTYKGPSRKEYGKKPLTNKGKIAAPAPAAAAAPVNNETVSRLAKVFETLFADSDDEAQQNTANKNDTKLTVMYANAPEGLTAIDSKALDASKNSEQKSTLNKSQNSAFKNVDHNKDGKFASDKKNAKDSNNDSGPAPIIITADHPRNDMADRNLKTINTNTNSDQTDGTPLISPPRVLNTEGINDQNNVSDSTRFDSGFVAPANSLISDPNVVSNNRSPQGQLHGALDAPRNSSVNHLDGKNYEGAHLSNDSERKKEESNKLKDDKPVPVAASSIAPPSFIVGPQIAKEAKQEAGMINSNNNNVHNNDAHSFIRPTATNANANTGVSEIKKSVPIVHDSDKNAPKPRISPSASAARNNKK